MTDPVELFARLRSELEDLHALTIEGWSNDLPDEASRILAGQICNGLQRLHALADQVILRTGGAE